MAVPHQHEIEAVEAAIAEAAEHERRTPAWWKAERQRLESEAADLRAAQHAEQDQLRAEWEAAEAEYLRVREAVLQVVRAFALTKDAASLARSNYVLAWDRARDAGVDVAVRVEPTNLAAQDPETFHLLQRVLTGDRSSW